MKHIPHQPENQPGRTIPVYLFTPDFPGDTGRLINDHSVTEVAGVAG